MARWRYGKAGMWMLVWCVAAVGYGQEYQIKLHRPMKLGDKFELSIVSTVKETTTTKSDGKQLDKEEAAYKVELTGELEVLGVDAKGRPLKLALTVSRGIVTEGDDIVPFLARNEVLTAETSEGETQYSIDGEDLQQEYAEILRTILPTIHPEDLDEDQLYGSSKPRKTGETWSVDADAVAKQIRRELSELKQVEVTGQVKLAGLETYEGRECLLLVGEQKLSNFKFAAPADGFQISEGSAKGSFGILLPTDGITPSLHEIEKGSSRIVMQGVKDDTKGLEVILETTETTEWRTIPIKKENTK